MPAARQSSPTDLSSTRSQQHGSVPVPDPTILTTQQLQREITATREVVEYQIKGIQEVLETRLTGMDRAVDLLREATNSYSKIVEDSINHLKALHDEKFISISIQFSEREKRFDIANKDAKDAVGIAFASSSKSLDTLREDVIKNTNQMILHMDNIKSVYDEKFHSIAVQFTERDVRTEQSSKDSKVAVDAALQAAKEAVDQQNKSNALAIAKSETTFTKQIDQIGALIATLQKGLDDKIDDLKTRVQAVESNKKGGNETMGFVIGALGITVAVIAGIVNLIPHVAK